LGYNKIVSEERSLELKRTQWEAGVNIESLGYCHLPFFIEKEVGKEKK